MVSDATGLNTQAAATRLGADTALALPAWTLPDNNQWLHPSPTDGTCGCPDGNTRVPTDVHYRDRDTVRHVLAHTGTPSLYRHGALALRLDPVLGLRTRV